MQGRVFVTGGTGFIGRHLISNLAERGYDVTALCRTPWLGRLEELPHARWIAGDIRDYNSVAEAARGAEIVFHLATTVSGSEVDWTQHEEVGVRGTEVVVAATEATAAARLVFLSSATVYRQANGEPIRENHALADPATTESHYVRQKVLAECAVWRADSEGRISATVLRPPRVIGPGDPRLLSTLGKQFTSAVGGVLCDGTSRVPYVVVEDLVDGLICSASRPVAAHRAYNLASRFVMTKDELRRIFEREGYRGPETSLRRKLMVAPLGLPFRAAKAVHHRNGLSPLAVRGKMLAARWNLRGATDDRVLDCSAAKSDLGWVGDGDVGAAIRHTIAWERSRRFL